MNAKEKEVLKKLKELVKEFNGLKFPDDWEGETGEAGKKVIDVMKVTAKMAVDEVGSMLETATSTIADISIELIPDEVFEAYNAVCDDIEALKKETGSSEPDAGGSEDNTGSSDPGNEPNAGAFGGGSEDAEAKAAEKKRIAKEKRDAKKKNETSKTPKVSKPVPESGKVILELFNLLSENQVDELKPDTMRQVLKLMKK